MNEPMTNERIALIRRRAEAATPGPWLPEISMTDEMTAHYAIRTRDALPEHPWSPRFVAWMTGLLREVSRSNGPPSTYCESCRHVCWRGREITVDVRQDAQTEADADFIAQARQDIPDLLAELEHIQAHEQATMEGCVAVLTKARDALYGVLAALGLGYGASELLDELDEAVRQLSVGRDA